MLSCVKQEMVLDQTCTMIKFTLQNSHSTSALLQQQPDKRLKSDAAKDGMEDRRGGEMGGGGYPGNRGGSGSDDSVSKANKSSYSTAPFCFPEDEMLQ